MRIAFAVNSIGLGHATRCVPLIRALIAKKHELYIISSFRALSFLRKEFGDQVREYFDITDYSIPDMFTKEKFSIRKFILKSPNLMKDLLEEHTHFRKLHKKHRFERIISDSRFGIFDKRVPSYLIFHHFKLGVKFNSKLSETATELFYFGMKNRFRYWIVPDFEKNGVGGGLCHDFRFFTDQIKYMGITSMIQKLDCKQDIDYFFSVSGPEPQRTVFEKKVLSQLSNVPGKVVVTLGKPESQKVQKRGDAVIYDFLDREKQQEFMNRAKLVITRSGYTTLMELAELGKKALIVPTKGQPEQEHLGEYHMKIKTFYSVDQDNLDLTKDLRIAEAYPGYISLHKTDKSVQNFMKIACL